MVLHLPVCGDIVDICDQPLGKTSIVTHRIDIGGKLPVQHQPYRVPATEQRIIHDDVGKSLSNCIIQPSVSPWSSAVVLVRKKDGIWWFCVDYPPVYKITMKDVCPLPCFDDTVDCIPWAEYFSFISLPFE